MRLGAIAAAAAALLATASAQAPALAQAQAQVQAPASDWRTVAPENLLVIDTSKGRILVELTPVAAPSHAERIRTLADQGFYDGLKFHRVIPDFMAQTGDPQGTGEGGSDLPDLKAEFSFRRGRDAGFVAVPNAGQGVRGLVGVLPVETQPDAQMMVTADFKVDAHGLFCPGVLGMARAGSPDSANSQFFLMMGERDQLNGAYTAFGRVLQGVEVVKAIKTGEPVPDPQDKMLSVKILADMPADKRPTIQVMDTRGAAFKALVTKRQGELGASFTNCDVDVPAQVK
jgi:peptidylprolyl isomerase